MCLWRERDGLTGETQEGGWLQVGSGEEKALEAVHRGKDFLGSICFAFNHVIKFF